MPVRVPAPLDELEIRLVRHGRGVDPEGGNIDLVRGPLVVVGPGLIVRSEQERAARDEDLASRGGRSVTRPRRLHRRVVDAVPPQLKRGEHRLDVLVLVLDDHPVDEPVREERVRAIELDPVEDRERPRADGVHVRPRLGRTKERERRPLAPRVEESVVEVGVAGVHRLDAAELLDEPPLLEVADVREVPDERRHERRVLADLVVLGHGGEKRERSLSCRLERGADRRLQVRRSVSCDLHGGLAR